MALSDGAVLLKLNRRKVPKIAIGDATALSGALDFYLPHVRVTTVLVVADHSDLDHKHADWFLANVFDRNVHPTLITQKIE